MHKDMWDILHAPTKDNGFGKKTQAQKIETRVMTRMTFRVSNGKLSIPTTVYYGEQKLKTNRKVVVLTHSINKIAKERTR